MKNSEILYTESRIQQDCVKFYKNSCCLVHSTPRCLILAIPNENQPFLTDIGLYAGASDILVIHRNTVEGEPLVVWVEVKTEVGTQKPAQIKFQAHVEGMGFQYEIVRSLEEFQKLVETWKTKK